MERINAEYWTGGLWNLAPPGCFTQERGLKPEYTKKFLIRAAKTEASPSATAPGRYCCCARHMWYLKSPVHLETMGSSGVPCPWEHSVLFYSEDNKPKALTNGNGRSRSCRGMAAIIWNLGIGRITPMCYSIILVGLNGCSNQSSSICTHRQGKGTSFFASLQLLQTKSNS